jgi:CO dehydrogenase/acetyl-CoA synthase delta subunit
MPGAAFVSILLESADPNGDNASVEDCVALCKAVAEKVTLPLVIQGSGNVEKDKEMFPKIADETITEDVEGLASYLAEKSHPVLELEPLM